MRSTAPKRRDSQTRLHKPVLAFTRLLDGLLAASAVAIVAFHGWLFWTHISSGHILDPATAARWTAAGILVIALLTLRRLGVSLLWSRHAAVLWVLVALLHCGIATPAPAHGSQPGADPALLFVVPSVTAVVLTGVAGIWLLARRRAAGLYVGRPRALWLVMPPVSYGLASGFLTCRAPRPPPL